MHMYANEKLCTATYYKMLMSSRKFLNKIHTVGTVLFTLCTLLEKHENVINEEKIIGTVVSIIP